MKPKFAFVSYRISRRRLLPGILPIAIVLALPAPQSRAADGTWNTDASGNWSAPGVWNPDTPGTIGTVAGDVVGLTFNITGSRIVTIDTTSRTVGDLNIGDPSGTTRSPYTLAASGGAGLSLDGGTQATIDFTGIGNTLSVPLTLVDNGIFRSNLPTPQIVAGLISGSGKSLTFNNDTDGTLNAPASNSGQFQLDGANIYTGGTFIADVRVQSNSVTGFGGGGVTVSGAGQAYLPAAVTTATNFTLNSTGWVESTGNLGALRVENGTVAGTIVMQQHSRIGSHGATGTISGVISGAFNLTKPGTGTLVLTGANTYSGTTTVSDGALRASHASALGSHPAVLVENNDGAASNTNALQLAGGLTFGAGKTLTLRNSATSGTLSNARAALENTTGNNTWAGAIVLDGSSHQTLNAAATTTFTITGDLSQAATPSALMYLRGDGSGILNGTLNLGSATLYKTDAGSWTINSTGNALGDIAVVKGSLVINNHNALGVGQALDLGQSGADNTSLIINGGFSQAFSAIGNDSASNGTHTITGAGTLSSGAANCVITVADGSSANDLTITTGLAGSGGFTKAGAGSLMLGNALLTNALILTAGTTLGSLSGPGSLVVKSGATLVPGTTSTLGTIAVGSLAFGTGSHSVPMNIGNGPGDQITVTNPGGLTTSGGITTFTITPAGNFTVGTSYPLISYTGASPGTAGFAVGPLPGRVVVAVTDTGTAIALRVTGNTKVKWTGASSAVWDLNTTPNWQTIPAATAVTYLEGDDLVFDNSGINTSLALGIAVNPAAVDFQNTTAVSYRIAGTGALTGAMALTKSGNGTVTLANPNPFTGATTLSAGTLELDYNGGSLTATSGVTVAAGATLKLTHDDGNFTFDRALSGAGTVVLDPHSAAGAAVRNVTFNGANSNFSGTVILAPSTGIGTTGGTFRTGTNTNFGSALVVIKAGAQAYLDATTYANNFTLTGHGYAEAGGGTPVAGSGLTAYTGTAAGGMGAIRMSGTTLTGNLTLDGPAKISAASTSTITGNITNTNPTDTFVAGGTSASGTLILTGNNSGLENIWVNSGGFTSTTATTDLLQIGAAGGGTSGTLGSGDVILHADTARTAILRLWRTDGYTLAPGQDILADGTLAADYARTQLHINCAGPGLTLANNQVILSDIASGVGGTVYVGGISGTNPQLGSLLNIQGASQVKAGLLSLGNHVLASGSVNQASTSAVTLTNILRIGYYANLATPCLYNLTGGSLTLSAAAPATTPSVTGSEPAGGIYLGMDGLGHLTQSGNSTINTKFIVLDGRTDTAGNDSLTLNGGTLNLQSQWGLIARFPGSSTVTLNGGSIVHNAPAGTAVVIDAPVTVGASGGILNTSADSTNSVVLTDQWTGNPLTLVGTGKLIFSPNSKATRDGTSDGLGAQMIATNLLAGAVPLEKTGTGTTLLTGTNTCSGITTVTAGTLQITGSLNESSVTVGSDGTLSGEGSVKSLTFANSAEILVDPTTPTALTAVGSVAATGAIIDVTLTGPITGTAPIRIFNYTGTAPATTVYAIPNISSYRDPKFTTNATNVTLALGNLALTWTNATADGTWDTDGAENWNTSVPAPARFFFGDLLTFNDAPGADQLITLAGTLEPGSMTFNNSAHSYTLTASSGNVIAGATGLLKTGTNSLTMAGPAANTFLGGTTLSQGTIQVQHGGSLGTGAIILGTPSTVANPVALYLDTTRSTVANPITVANFGTTATLGSRSSVTGTGDTNQFTNITLARDVIFDSNAAERTDYENITGTGNITVTGTGRTVFITTNPFVGNVTVNVGVGGHFQTGSSSTGVRDFIPDTSNLIVNDTPGNTIAEYRLSCGGETIAGLSGNGTLTVTGIAGTLTVGAGDVSSTFAGTMTNSSSGANLFSLTKIGSGTLTLTGTSTATGATAVDGGTLAGTGALASAVTINTGATLAPGAASIAPFATGTLTLAAGATLAAELNSTGTPKADRVNVTGNVTLAGNLTVTDVAGVPAVLTVGTKLTIVSYTGTLTGEFNGKPEGATFTAGSHQFKIRYNDSKAVTLEALSSSTFAAWKAGFTFAPGADQTATGDPDRDGLPNAVEMVVAGNPANVSNASLAPQLALVTNPGGGVPDGQYLKFTFRRSDQSVAAALTAVAESSSTLAGAWTPALDGTAGVRVLVTNDFYSALPGAGVDKVEVFIPRAGIPNLFGRLKVTVP